MSVYRQNITNANYERNIDVLVQTEDDAENYGRAIDDNRNVSSTSRYLREPPRLYAFLRNDRGFHTFQTLHIMEDEMNEEEETTMTDAAT